MERMDIFEHQDMICCRKEIPGLPPVKIIVKKKTTIRDGKSMQEIVTDWRGHHLLIMGEKQMEVDRSVTLDLGKKLGISLGTEDHRETPFTEEEKELGRQRVKEVATQLMIRAGIW